MIRALGLLLAAFGLAAGCGTRADGDDGSSGLVILPAESASDPRPYYHDFGRVPDGEVAVHVFRLQNTDPRDVAITRVTPGCGCTMAALRSVAPDGVVTQGEPAGSKAEKLLVVPSGHVAEVELRIDTKDLLTKNQDKLILVAVASDSPKSFYQNFELHIVVEQPLLAVPPSLVLGDIPTSGGGTGSVDIVQAGSRSVRPKELAQVPDGVHAELTSEYRLGTDVWVLRAGFDAPLDLGPHRSKLVIATETTDGGPARPLEIELFAQAVPDLASSPTRLVFAAPRAEPASASVEFFSLLSGHRLRVTGLELPPEHEQLLEVRAEPQELDDATGSPRWTIHMSTRPPLPEGDAMLDGKLIVRLDDPQHASVEIPYVVHVR